MQAGSIVDDTLKDIQHFRILCVGRSGVGKSSLINRVFRLEKSTDAAPVSHWKPGDADIDKGFTSPENNYIVVHDSKGLELANTEAFNDVDSFIRQRCDSNLPLKDQLHAVWLCTEVPRAGGHIIEKGDENLLRLARGTGTPVVIVLTKYDRLVKTKRVELQEDGNTLSEDVLHEKSKEEAQKALNVCIESLQRTLRDMDAQKSQTPKPHHVNVSNEPGYEASISSLVQVTCELVSDKLKLMWAIAQRASRQVKINACIDIAMCYHKIPSGPSFRRMSLRDCLGRVHQDIITCWNFRDEEKTLNSYEFKNLMQDLVQDVRESHSQDGHLTPLTADPSAPIAANKDVIDSTRPFADADWLSCPVLGNEPPVQRLLMVYTTNLITVLKSLFDVVEPSSSKRIMWPDLSRVFGEYEQSPLRGQVHDHIWANFQHDQQIGDEVTFRQKLCGLLKYELPLSVSVHNKTGYQDPQAQVPGAPASSPPSTREPLSSPGTSPQVPPPQHKDPPPPREDPPPPREGPSTARKDPPPPRKDPLPPRKDPPPSREGPSIARKDPPPPRKDPPPSREDPPPPREGPSTARKDSLPPHNDPPPPRKDPPPSHKDHSTARKDPPSTRKDPPPTHEDPSTARKDATQAREVSGTPRQSTDAAQSSTWQSICHCICPCLVSSASQS